MSQTSQPIRKPAALDPVAVAMGVGFAVMWSSAFTSAKIALVDAPPMLLLTVRFFLSGGIAVGLAYAAGQRPPRSARSWALIVLLGLCQNSLYLGLNFTAMTAVPAGFAAIVASTLPLWVAAVGALALGERLPRAGVVGLALGLTGTIAVMAGRVEGGIAPWGAALCVGGVLALTVATLVVRHARLGTGVLMVTGLQMLAGGLALAPIALAVDSVAEVTPTLSLALAFAYIVGVPGLAATFVWFRLVQRIGATNASAYHFLNPALGVGIAWLVLGERIGPIDLAGVAVITTGIALVQRARRA